MTERILILAAVMGIPLMIREFYRWFRAIDGCRTCHILGWIPCGPPYWILQAHLRRTCQARPGEQGDTPADEP